MAYMVDTFYLHLEFAGKRAWSINLPFLCIKCGDCCKLDDFLTAGKLNVKPEEYAEVQAKVKRLCEDLGKMWDADEAKYDAYLIQNECPFLINNSCSIYEIRPDGCRLFPKTTFGMQTQNCPPLTRFKKMRAALKKGRATTENYYFTGNTSGVAECIEPIKPARFTQKQYQACVAKLRRAGMTNDELTFFRYINGQDESPVQR